MSEAKYTSDHDAIRKWAEQRGGKPATVSGTQTRGAEVGVLRIDFPGHGEDEGLEHISWDDWFSKFDENNLVMVLQDERSDGETSRFNKIVARDSVDEEAGTRMPGRK